MKVIINKQLTTVDGGIVEAGSVGYIDTITKAKRGNNIHIKLVIYRTEQTGDKLSNVNSLAVNELALREGDKAYGFNLEFTDSEFLSIAQPIFDKFKIALETKLEETDCVTLDLT
jgi:hypothetical protein